MTVVVIFLLAIAIIAGILISSHTKSEVEETNQETNKAQRFRDLGFPVIETRTDEVDGVECDVANFAVKGLYSLIAD